MWSSRFSWDFRLEIWASLDLVDGVSEALDLQAAGLNVEGVVHQVHGAGGSDQLTGAVQNVA